MSSKAMVPILLGLIACCCLSSVVAGGLWAGNVLCDTTDPGDQSVGMNCASVYESSGSPATGTPAAAGTPAALTPAVTPTSSLIASGKALQVSEIDLGAASVPATNKPTLTVGPVTTPGFSLSMWVKLPATVTPGVWWTLFGMDGHYVTLIPDTGTPTLWEIVFSTTGPAGTNWSYMYRLTPGTYYRLGFVVSPPSAPTFYLDGGSGMTGANMIGGGAVSHGSTGSDARFNPNNSPLTGIKVKNVYYFGKSLSASEMALLGASGMGSGTTSGYMPQPLSMGVSGYTKEGYMVPY